MLGSGGGGSAAGTHSWLGRAQWRLGPRERFCSAGLFCIFPFFCIIVVTVPFVCCSVKLPLSRPTSFCRVALLLPTAAETRTFAYRVISKVRRLALVYSMKINKIQWILLSTIFSFWMVYNLDLCLWLHILS